MDIDEPMTRSSAGVSVSSSLPARAVARFRASDPTVMMALTVLAFAVPVAGYLALVQHYQVNAVFGDQWSDVTVIRQSYRHFFDFSSLWSPHTDNRILFPNLIVLGLTHTVHFNIDVEEDLSALMLLGATALLIWSHKRRSPDTPMIAYAPVVFLTCTLAQWSNALWGFQMAWFLVVLALALSIVLLDRPTLTLWSFLAAILVAVVGSYSSLQGLLIWPVGLVLLYHRRRPLWAFVSWIAAACTTAGLYFYNFPNGLTGVGLAGSPRSPLSDPFLAIKFYLYALGDIVGQELNLGERSDPMVIVFGCVIFAVAVFVLFRWGVHRDPRSGMPIGIALIVFGLLFDLLITWGRIGFGLLVASASRYTTNDVMVLAGIYLTVLGGSTASSNDSTSRLARGPDSRWQPIVASLRSAIRRIDRAMIMKVALTAIVIQVIFSVYFGIEGARGQHQIYVNTAAYIRNVDHESNQTLHNGLGTIAAYPGGWLRMQIEVLQEHHLSLFG